MILWFLPLYLFPKLISVLGRFLQCYSNGMWGGGGGVCAFLGIAIRWQSGFSHLASLPVGTVGTFTWPEVGLLPGFQQGYKKWKLQVDPIPTKNTLFQRDHAFVGCFCLTIVCVHNHYRKIRKNKNQVSEILPHKDDTFPSRHFIMPIYMNRFMLYVYNC